MDILRLRGCCRVSATDRPYRFISNQRICKCSLTSNVKHRVQLRGDGRSHSSGFAFGQRFTHAQYWPQTCIDCGLELARNLNTGFTVMLAALGMSDQNKARANIRQHRSGYLTGIRALLMLAHILSTESQRRIRKIARKSGKIWQRWQEDDLNPGLQPHACCNLPYQFYRKCTLPIEFPVSSNNP